MSILCRLGLHSWEDTYVRMTEPYEKLVPAKRCRRCPMIRLVIVVDEPSAFLFEGNTFQIRPWKEPSK